MNVKELREKSGLTQAELAEKTGIPRDRIAKWEQGKGSPKGEDTLTLMKVFRELVPHEKTDSDNLLKEHIEPYYKQRLAKKNNDQPFMVPFVPVKAQAGYTKSYDNTDFINDLQSFPIWPGVDPHGAVWRYFEVEGDSMLDTFKHGQFLLTSQVTKEDWTNIENFYVYVIVTDDKIMVKRLAKVKGKDYWAAISDNEEKYKQFKLPVQEVKELWKYRRHMDWDASPQKKFEIKV